MILQDVILNTYCWKKYGKFSGGVKFEEWINGDEAVHNRHHSLLSLNQNLTFSPKAWETAVQKTDFISLEWLYEKKRNICFPEKVPSLWHFAALSGHLDICEWVQEKEIPAACSEYVMDIASMKGHLELVKWLHRSRKEGCTEAAMDWAAKSGHIHVVEWLSRNRGEGCSYRAMDAAAENGDIRLLEWLHSNRSEGFSLNAMILASSQGHLHVIEWLIQRDQYTDYATNMMDRAAGNGHIHVLEYLHRKTGSRCSNSATTYAALRGHLKTLEWLHENLKITGTDYAMTRAAKYGHLDVCEWLHEMNRHQKDHYRVLKYALRKSVKRGHMQIVEWLHYTLKVGWGAEIFKYAAKRGRLREIEWFVEQSPILFADVAQQSYELAFEAGHINAAAWISQQM
mmetsp:Transcript_16125/g.21322  ORF Transcript_16125/g.21322 Transcript_16125/m.21322 type:complete len:398 (+) Transcript_16125:115-1308(+)|eukprot:CAMPEP_0117734800 /NCGR_PEP_ID=MMETSP0947-20121206/902_1 /TAXON_ID=44440 /ORGANISM="Chattonella subsalsa, Strain CCMP2191" /LENGTH=397 /DNA_ID=CAMNT_0005549673 /DNA_START=118 /DNA_END=1311 /DNA_ORIENTATION=-